MSVDIIYWRLPHLWVFIVAGLAGIFLLKGLIGLFRAAYSPKIRLLNYLYSPYVIAWRRDHWSEYTDKQIANAICLAAGISPDTIEVDDRTLDGFLLALCRKTRPKQENDEYPNVLKKLHDQASGMKWRNQMTSKLENDLKFYYSSLLQIKLGFPYNDAVLCASDIIEKAKKESEKSETKYVPSNYGKILLRLEHTGDANTCTYLQELRNDGVTDEDIIKWWNISDLERQCFRQFCDFQALILYNKIKEEENLTDPAIITNKARKFCPVFGQPVDTEHISGANRPIPYELGERVVQHMRNKFPTLLFQYPDELVFSSSCNAFLRSEIKKGNL